MNLALKLLSTRFGNALSRAVGWAAAKKWPGPILRMAIRCYSKAYGVRLDEAASAPESYVTFLEFFTRELRSGLRPLHPGPLSLVSPVDGRLAAAGPLLPEALIQAKRLTYRMGDLVGCDEWAATWTGGIYINLYLHPADYHRVHAPTDLRILESVHLPGRLLPVNDWSRGRVRDLYTTNERIVTRAEVAGGELLLVLVGATSVGRVRLTFDDLTTNDGSRVPRRRTYQPAVELRRGEELGRFELGSTVILLLPPGLCELGDLEAGSPVRVGECLGTLRHPRADRVSAKPNQRLDRLAEDVGIEPTTP